MYACQFFFLIKQFLSVYSKIVPFKPFRVCLYVPTQSAEKLLWLQHCSRTLILNQKHLTFRR